MKPQFRLRRAPLAAVSVLAFLAACSDSITAPGSALEAKRKQPAPTPAPAPDTTVSFYQGVYLGDLESKPETIVQAQRDFASLAGKQASLVKSFHSLNCDFTAGGWCGQVLRQAASTGATNYVALDLTWTGAPATGLLDAIAAGQADARLVAVARGIQSVGQTVLLEPGWEMNGNWSYAWQGVQNANDPARYAAAWRHVVDIFRREGATNVRWVWNPNFGNPVTHTASGATSWNWYANYYPGDSYVDYVGAHGFNAPAVWGGSWNSFTEMTDGVAGDHMLSDLAARFPTKKIIVGEFATAEGTADAKAQWITEAYQKLRANPRVAGAVWFNASKEANWRIDSSPTALTAFRTAMADAAIKTAFTPVAPAATRLASR